MRWRCGRRPGGSSTYVGVAEDPLADVAAAWQAMWDVASGPGGTAGFEARAAEALDRLAGQAVRTA